MSELSALAPVFNQQRQALKYARPPSCAEEEAWRMYMLGEKSFENLKLDMAILAAGREELSIKDNHRPKPYCPLVDMLAGYVRGRESDSRPYDAALAKKVGVWALELRKALMDNVDAYERLVDQKALLERAGLKTPAAAIGRAIRRFEAQVFPKELYDAAQVALRRDADVRRLQA